MRTTVPAELVQGTSHEWLVSYSDIPTSGHTLTYVFRSANQRLTVSGVAQTPQAWKVKLTPDFTAQMDAGFFKWQAFIEDSGGSIRINIGEGGLRVQQNLAIEQPNEPDPRSYATKQLERYNAMLSDMTLVKTLDAGQIAELERIRKQLECDVKREKDAEKLKAGGYPTRKIFTRFA